MEAVDLSLAALDRFFDLAVAARGPDFAVAVLDLAVRLDWGLETLFDLRVVVFAFAEEVFRAVAGFFAATGFLVFEVLLAAAFPVA